MHFLHSRLDFPATNVDDTSDEHEKEFNLDISSMERGYQGHWNPNMMYDCYWFLQQSASDFQRRLRHFYTACVHGVTAN